MASVSARLAHSGSTDIGLGIETYPGVSNLRALSEVQTSLHRNLISIMD